ncbi:MAG: NAD-dependent epimerase/dehydratase family protein [archaeon]
MPKIFVTGGAGFIGSHLVDALVDKNEVIVLDNLSTGKKENLNLSAKLYEVDIRNEKISEIFKKEKLDYVFHLAAQTSLKKSLENPELDREINYEGSMNIFNSAVSAGVERIIFTSTAGVYSPDCEIPTPVFAEKNPVSEYGRNKLSAELFLNPKKFSYVILRLANVYGPRQNNDGEGGVIAIFSDKISKTEKIYIYGDGEQTRDFIYVEDVVDALLLAREIPSGIYNIGTGKETSINSLIKIFGKITGKKIEKNFFPETDAGQLRSALDSTDFHRFRWNPKTILEEGLKKTYKWFESR